MSTLLSFFFFMELLGLCGRGATGIVYKAIHRQTKKEHAIKAIERKVTKNFLIQLFFFFESISKTENQFFFKVLTEQMERQVRREVKILRKLNHKYILKAFESFESSGKIFFVLELCTGGTVQNEVLKQGVFTEARAARLMYQLLDAGESKSYSLIHLSQLFPFLIF